MLLICQELEFVHVCAASCLLPLPRLLHLRSAARSSLVYPTVDGFLSTLPILQVGFWLPSILALPAHPLYEILDLPPILCIGSFPYDFLYHVDLWILLHLHALERNGVTSDSQEVHVGVGVMHRS